MASFPETDYLRERAHALRMGLFFRLQEFVDDYPSDTPELHIRILEDVLSRVERVITHATDKRTLSLVCTLIEQLSLELNTLDNAHTARTPRGLAQMLSAMSDAINRGAPSLLIVAPTIENNYSILDLREWLLEITENVLDSTEHASLDATLPPRYSLIQFPRIERDNVLVHALFGHEFGHPIADEFLDDYLNGSNYPKDIQDITKEIAGHIAKAMAGKPQADQDKAKMAILNTVEEIFKDGLRELASDVVAVYFFGPSAIFAAVDFFLQYGLDDAPQPEEYYPPSRYRLRRMTEILEKENYYEPLRGLPKTGDFARIANASEAALSFIKETTRIDTDRAAINSGMNTQIAYKWIEKVLSAVDAFSKSKLKDVSFDPKRLNAELQRSLERLIHGVPAGELGVWPKLERIDWRSGLVAGWLLKLEVATRPGLSMEERASQIASIQKLAILGVEYALLRENYDKFKATR